jgi:CubicO group peptidase (beta-lactamase class C family)
MERIATALLAAQCLAASYALAAAPDCAGSSQTPWPTKDWERSTPEAQGMDSGALARLVDFVGTFKQDSLLIIRHGKTVVDAYYAPYAPNIRHDLRSVTKSFIGTLTAIEVQEGLLDSVDHPIVDLFADKHISNIDAAKKAMTVRPARRALLLQRRQSIRPLRPDHQEGQARRAGFCTRRVVQAIGHFERSLGRR